MKVDKGFKEIYKSCENAVNELEDIGAKLYGLMPAGDIIGIRKNIGILKENMPKVVLQDSLTGLLNKGGLKIRYDEEVSNLQREAYIGRNIPISVVAMDLDGFKGYNDRFGHPEGDKVLIDFAEVISRNIRPKDHAARNGGDEFVMLLPGANVDMAKAVGERVRKGFEGYCNERKILELSVSVGIASYSETTKSLDELMGHADKALYESKGNGKNTLFVYGLKKD